MRAINHALTGAIIGLTVGEPLVAVPAALASHYVLDVIPHHGEDGDKLKWLRSGRFESLLVIDALLCLGLVLALAFNHPLNWLLAAVCAFVAAAPDFLSINRYIKAREGKKWTGSWYTVWAGKIQWFERPIGAVVELAWFAGAIVLLAPLLS